MLIREIRIPKKVFFREAASNRSFIYALIAFLGCFLQSSLKSIVTQNLRINEISTEQSFCLIVQYFWPWLFTLQNLLRSLFFVESRFCSARIEILISNYYIWRANIRITLYLNNLAQFFFYFWMKMLQIWLRNE